MPLASSCLRRLCVNALLMAGTLLFLSAAGLASGPRWVTGPPYFTGPSGVPVVWYTIAPLYFTDPGDLSATVNHVAADALVAAAAGVWNVQTSAMTIAYGGSLDEHVSSANAYLTDSGPVFPTDVQSSNYVTKQIAIIYDHDGSVTDMLLGSGASSPAECLHNAVTESVDSISPSGNILHALLILNGRCTGTAPEQQFQMQYQLQRAFGRILGIGWSQTNDNVFTQNPTPTYAQAMHWPIMHPIDIICGLYTYQCLPQPFTLRDDDTGAISSLYPMIVWNGWPANPPMPAKLWTYELASQANGTLTFPTGEGMQGVNVLVTRWHGGYYNPETWFDSSSVSGYLYRQSDGNPVLGSVSEIAGSMGSPTASLQGFYNIAWVPDADPPSNPDGPMHGVVSTEPINPLYIGAYSVGPYVAGAVSPSGTTTPQVTQYPMGPNIYTFSPAVTNFAPAAAAENCYTGSDGIETSPAAVPATGWWTGVLCAYSHAAWSSFTPQSGRTATIEATALDESGFATTAKAMPLIGIWNSTDATGTLPTVAATPAAFNSIGFGTTAASISITQTQALRFVVADTRGDGRPDFAYQARVLYADSVQPAVTSVNGGQITIQGMGFRTGNSVTVNGVPAAVSSWSANTIVAVAPPEAAFPTNPTGAVDIVVADGATGGSTVITGALTYGGVPPDRMSLVSAPSGSFAVNATVATPFAVRVNLGDGVTPVAGLGVTFSTVSGAAQLSACPAVSCVILTDLTGMASITVTPTALGTVTLRAAAAGVSQVVSFTVASRSITPFTPTLYVAGGSTVVWTPQALVMQDSTPVAALMVTWAASTGMALSQSSTLSDSSGMAQTRVIVGPLAAGIQSTLQACAWTTTCASFNVIAVDPSAWRLSLVSGSAQAVPVSGNYAPVVLVITDAEGDPVAGAPVTIYQTVSASEMLCPVTGRCPVSPVLTASTSTAVSDIRGQFAVLPAQASGVSAVTSIAAATGTQGFVSLALTRGP